MEGRSPSDTMNRSDRSMGRAGSGEGSLPHVPFAQNLFLPAGSLAMMSLRPHKSSHKYAHEWSASGDWYEGEYRHLSCRRFRGVSAQVEASRRDTRAHGVRRTVHTSHRLRGRRVESAQPDRRVDRLEPGVRRVGRRGHVSQPDRAAHREGLLCRRGAVPGIGVLHHPVQREDVGLRHR